MVYASRLFASSQGADSYGIINVTAFSFAATCLTPYPPDFAVSETRRHLINGRLKRVVGVNAVFAAPMPHGEL